MMGKRKPFRSTEFLRFVHTTRAQCCVCQERPFTRLHHFGSDGGKGMKPSDNEVCRLCNECAVKHEIKRRAMMLRGRWELLATMEMDALELNRLWIQRLLTKVRKKDLKEV